MSANLLARVRRYRALGLSVIPVPPPRPGVRDGSPGDGKTPTIRWKRYQREHPTDADLVRWFARHAMNVAIITGAVSDLVTVDADNGAALKWCTAHLPYSPWQTRTAWAMPRGASCAM